MRQYIQKNREQLRAIGTTIVSNVVVVWVTSDCLIALHCSFFRSCLCSVVWRFTVGLHHLSRGCSSSTTVAALAVKTVQTPFPFLTACQFHMHHRQGKLQDEVSRFLSLLPATRYQTLLHERNNDTFPMLFELILRQDVWFQDLRGSRLQGLS